MQRVLDVQADCMADDLEVGEHMVEWTDEELQVSHHCHASDNAHTRAKLPSVCVCVCVCVCGVFLRQDYFESGGELVPAKSSSSEKSAAPTVQQLFSGPTAAEVAAWLRANAPAGGAPPADATGGAPHSGPAASAASAAASAPLQKSARQQQTGCGLWAARAARGAQRAAGVRAGAACGRPVRTAAQELVDAKAKAAEQKARDGGDVDGAVEGG